MRGGNSGGRGPRRGRGRGRGRGEKVSADDLDAELEKYHAEAMQETWKLLYFIDWLFMSH